MEDMTWYSAVRGRGAMEVVWVKDVLPKRLQETRLPIIARLLDPLNVGVKRGPLYTEYAYHEYDASPTYVRQNYPKYKLDETKYGQHGYHGSKECKIVSFWYHGDDGSVWHCVTIDGKFAKKPTKTDYPDLPIIEWTGDGAPIEDETYRSLSILHPLKDLYPYKCRLASQIGTGLLYYFYPIIKAFGFNGDVTVGPGETVSMPSKDATLDMLRPDMNVNLAQTMLTMVDQQIQQSTFPSVMYGDAGGASSGYAINQLGQSAKGRVGAIRGNQEGAIERADELVFALVEIFGGDEGVNMWGKSAQEGRSRPVILKGKDIKGNYANKVTLVPEIPTDETQRITTWLQLVNAGIISKATYRDRILNIPLPRDEDLRVTIEQGMMAPEMSNKKTLRAIQAWYKDRDDWELMIQGTPLEQIYQQEQQMLAQQAAEKEAEKAARKEQRDMQRMMESLPPEILAQLQGGMPPGMPPQGPPIGPGMPGMGDMGAMGGGGMPPMPMQEGSMGPPPGMMPPGMGPEGMPPGAMPPGMPLPGMEGMPGEMTGQITPEMMGIPQGSPPGMFEQMTGQPVDEAEIRRQMMGLPPEGMM